MTEPERADRLAGALLGVALGDALGLPFEGLSALRVARRWEARPATGLLGRWRFVSDDTEQAALIAQALASYPEDTARCVGRFRRSMVGWFLRLPFGIGFGTLRACLRMMVGLREPGVASAGNGAAMRAGIVGAVFAGDPERRRNTGRLLARVTHTDERAVEAALFVAEVTARATRSASSAEPRALLEAATEVLTNAELVDAVRRGLDCARRDVPLAEAIATLGTSGFVVESIGLCSYCFARDGAVPFGALQTAVLAGGDTDTHAAIVGGWVGALHGARALPRPVLSAIDDGPFGPTHLERLAESLATGSPPPRWSWLHALARNLALYPVVLGLAVTRLFW